MYSSSNTPATAWSKPVVRKLSAGANSQAGAEPYDSENSEFFNTNNPPGPAS